MNRSTIIFPVMISIVALSIGGLLGWYKGLRDGAHATANLVQTELQSHNTLLLLVENAMSEPDEKKDESLRLLIINALNQNKTFEDVLLRPPFSMKPMYRDDQLIEEARERLVGRKIRLRYVEE